LNIHGPGPSPSIRVVLREIVLGRLAHRKNETERGRKDVRLQWLIGRPFKYMRLDYGHEREGKKGTEDKATEPGDDAMTWHKANDAKMNG